MTDIAHIDFETYSEIDIRKVGAHRYARHKSTEVLICAYLLPGMADPAVWLPRVELLPYALREYIINGGKIGAHNANFERAIWRYVLVGRTHRSAPPIKNVQWVCTAAKAAASGLPRSLEKALQAAGLTVEKDMEGSALIKVFCKPRKPTKADPRVRIFPEQEPAQFKRFIEYCQQDVRGEVALDEALPDLSSRQQTMFVLDMLMNDRGLPIDLPLVEKTLGVVQELEAGIAKRVTELTGGIKATQVAKMLEFFSEQGIDLENMRAETIRQACKNADLTPDARELLELRIQASKASTKKLISMMACADPTDHVVQGGFLYHGAHTGRYAGRLVQPHNFIRGMLKEHQMKTVFELLDLADAELFTVLYRQPIDTISQCMRGFIKAPEGLELAVVDYTAIEARVLAWVAGEETMLAAYRQGVDVYKLMAVKLFKLKSIADVSDEQRRIAKNLVLGCGYQLGGVRFVDYCANVGLIIEPEFAMKAVKAYRSDVPRIVESWGTIERLVVQAIRNPARKYDGLRCRFFMRQHWLCIRLPSGREIRYPYAKAEPAEKWGKPSWSISFRTEYKGKFLREGTYGGKLIENIVQGIAFDVMQEGMLSAEHNGYEVIGTVHDELLCLREEGTSDIKELEKLVCTIPAWSKGMPLAAKGFTCIRYRKD